MENLFLLHQYHNKVNLLFHDFFLLGKRVIRSDMTEKKLSEVKRVLENDAMVIIVL